MTNEELNLEYKSIINNIVAPILKKIHFKKSGSHFYRDTGEIIQTFNFQKSPHNLGSSFSFVGNIGLSEKETYLKLWNKSSLPKFPKYTDAIIRFRLGSITHNGLDKWYSLNKKTIHNLKDEIYKDVLTLEAFFENHKTLSSIEKFFFDPAKISPYFGYLVSFALYHKLGKQKKAKRIIKKLYSTASNTGSNFFEKLFHKNNKITNKDWVERIEKVARTYNTDLN